MPIVQLKCLIAFLLAGQTGDFSALGDEPRPLVQLIVISDSPRCGPCRALVARLKSRLVDDVKARGENAWDVSESADAQVRLVEVADDPKLVETLGINSVPSLWWWSEGRYQVTYQTEPAELAREFHRRLKKLEQ